MKNACPLFRIAVGENSGELLVKKFGDDLFGFRVGAITERCEDGRRHVVDLGKTSQRHSAPVKL